MDLKISPIIDTQRGKYEIFGRKQTVSIMSKLTEETAERLSELIEDLLIEIKTIKKLSEDNYSRLEEVLETVRRIEGE